MHGILPVFVAKQGAERDWQEKLVVRRNLGEKKMKYKKPQIVAKSDAKKSYVAGCPTNTVVANYCSDANTSCMCGKLD